ncbi:MAG TPA: protein kinase [Kofleriaceae bacterium]|nr:protein kinase [Kofleriaceae bacterium]
MADQSDDATRQDKPGRVSQPSLRVQPDFGPRYRVIGIVGKGGMGEVFRAYDTELKGEVALKIVRGDADHEEALTRFRREIALARKVTSPYVLRVYDISEHDGLRFLSMEFVDGEDLAALMRREKQLPIDRAVRIFRQVCEGLVAAHAQGVVHRDLKPQNVLVDKDGGVRVADFGLARSITESGLTASGAVLGSPAYMSPEQVKGDPTDERSDIYSLGIMLYQLVTGETPFKADTPHAVMEMRLHKKPRLLRDVRPDAPAYLEGIAAKCLALNPSGRYRTVKEVLGAVETGGVTTEPVRRVAAGRPTWLIPAIAAGALCAAGGVVAVLVISGGSKKGASPNERPALIIASARGPEAGAGPVATTSPMTTLVLPLTNTTSETSLDGTVEIIVTSSLRRSTVLDPITGASLRRVASAFGNDVAIDDKLAARIAERDGGRVLTVHPTAIERGAKLQIGLTVTDSTGALVFEETVEAPALDAVAPVTARLASALRGTLGETVAESERDRSGLSASLDADREYTLGLAAKATGDYSGASAHLERAIAKDSGFALARQNLAIVYENMGRMTQSRAQFERALASVDNMGERDRQKFLGDYYRQVTEEYDRAITHYKQLLAKWPKDLPAAANLCLAYYYHGDRESLLEQARKTAKEHPKELIVRDNLASFEISVGNYDRAIDEELAVLAEFPRVTHSVHINLAVAYTLSGKRDKALASVEKAKGLDASTGSAVAADLLAAEGRVREAIAELEKGLPADNKDNADNAELKQAMLARLYARQGNQAAARAAAAEVKNQPYPLLQAALVQLAVGDTKRALATASKFADDTAPSRRAYGRMIEAESLRLKGKPQQAMITLQEAIKLADTPLPHVLAIRAALDAKRYPEAYSELQAAIARRGEIALGDDTVCELTLVSELSYLLAKVQEGLGSPDAAKSYKAFIDGLHDPDANDPLVADARKHLQ